MIDAAPDWALWRTFLAILREASLSRAARALNVAHPTVRRHLEELEAALNAPLFVRSPSGLVPTDLARELREPAETMESVAAYMARIASAGAESISGTVRISASEVMGAEVLPPILAAAKARYPGIAIELVLSNAIENVLRNDADIAVRMLRPTHPDLVARRIGTVSVGLYAHRSWIDAHGMPGDIAAVIASGALIGYDRDTLLVRAFGQYGVTVTRADFGFRSDSNIAQLAALRAGLGIGACQQRSAAQDPALVRVLPAYSLALEVWLVVHPNQRGVARVRTVLQALEAGLSEYVDGSGTG